MHTIRSFIAFTLSREVQRAARRIAREMRGEKDGIKWVPDDNLHLTLKFLGDVEDREVPRVCSVIRQVCERHSPFELEFLGTGAFPNDERPRVVWIGITEGGDRLSALVTDLEKELAKLGFKPESRDYRPHLTLGRARGGGQSASSEVVEKIGRFKNRRLGVLPVDQVRLYASYLDKEGPTYNVMDRVPLGDGSSYEANDFSDDDDQAG